MWGKNFNRTNASDCHIQHFWHSRFESVIPRVWIQVSSISVVSFTFSSFCTYLVFWQQNVMTNLQISASISLPALRKFTRKVKCCCILETLEKMKAKVEVAWEKMSVKTKFAENAVFYVSAMFFIFPGWDLSVLVVSHSLTTQCYLPWLFSCLADMMFLPPHPAPHAISF